MGDELTAYLVLLPDAGEEAIPFAVLLPGDESFDWAGLAMPIQCRLKAVLQDANELITMQMQQAWPSDAAAWTPEAELLQSLQDFTREVASLLDISGEIPLLAPLLQGRSIAADGASWAEEVLDLATLQAVVDHCRGGSSSDTSTLLEMALHATGKTRSGKDSNDWLANHIASQQPEGLLAKLLRASSDDGYLATSLYAQRRSHWLLRAWPGMSAAEATLATGRKRRAQSPPEPGSLLRFLRERYGKEVSDTEQCIMEAADGPALRPWAAGSCGGHAVTPLSGWLMEGGGTAMAGPSDSLAASALRKEEADAVTPGPVRLLPQLLVPHPLPPHLQLSLRLLPVVLQKMQRLRVISGLRKKVLPSLPALRGLGSEPTCGLSMFQRPSYDETGRRHALCHERLALLAEEKRPLLQALEEDVADSPLSPVQIEWTLEVATTCTSAAEPYDATRLAWLGDAVVFLIATAWTLREVDLPLEERQRRSAALISNRCLARLALSALELPSYLATGFARLAAFVSCWAEPFGSRREKQALGEKAPADAMEALLGALVVVGQRALVGMGGGLLFGEDIGVVGLRQVYRDFLGRSTGGPSAAAQLLRQLPWFDSEDGQGFRVPPKAAAEEAPWLGSAMVRFCCSAWVLCNHPELAVDGLSVTWPCTFCFFLGDRPLGREPSPGEAGLALCREQFVGEKCELPLGKIYASRTLDRRVALSDLWAQLERSLPEEDDVPNLMTNMTQYRKSKTRRGGMNKRLARKAVVAASTTWILLDIVVPVDAAFLLEGSVVPFRCGIDWEVMLSRTASLGQQSLELTWLVCVRDTCTVSSWNSAGIRALKVECDTSILRTPTVASAVSSRSLPRSGHSELGTVMTMVTLMLVPHNSAMLLAGASSDAFGALRSELEHEQIPTIGMAHFSAEAGKVLCVIDVGQSVGRIMGLVTVPVQPPLHVTAAGLHASIRGQ
eukprot:s392_g25.t4